MTATVTAALTARPWTKLTPIRSMPSSEMTTVMPAKSTERPAVSMAIETDVAHVVAGVELFPVAGDDEQRVVDADAEADHDAEERGELGDR